MKIKQKIFLSVVTISTAILMLNPLTSYAALQGNGQSIKTDTLDNWLLNIRKMETAGGTLGLSDTINTTDLMSSAENSNNLDIHMEKNTEYGAMVILSASAYGNQNKINSGDTTTGNKSGVVMNINAERVSAGAGLTGTIYAKNANSRYINNDYTIVGNYHTGDAMDIGTWHSGGARWFESTVWSGLNRAYSGSIFSFTGDGDWNDPYAWIGHSMPTRAVVVVGSGL